MVGKVVLIGCGIGDPELLTIKAKRKIQEADVIIYDRLVNPAILNLAKAGSKKIDVGKKPNHHPVPQEEIEALLVLYAQQGKLAVRLKSGDPYVFGRGGEEGRRLEQAGISMEVVPGVTSAIAGLAYAGIPITHRDHAASFHVYTGHLKSPETALDWRVIAQNEGTLVFLMGMSELPTITDSLIIHGKRPDTPAAIVQWAGRSMQKTVTGTLANIAQKAQEAELVPPSLIVIGEVTSEREVLNFYEKRPLFGVTIAMPYTEKKQLYAELTDLGAEVIEDAAPQVFLNSLHLDWSHLKRVVFFEKESVDVFIESMRKDQIDWRYVSGVMIEAVGHHTRLTCEKHGILPNKNYESRELFIKTVADEQEKAVYLGSLATKETLPATCAESFLVSHTEDYSFDVEAWFASDFLFFPHSKSARAFLASLKKEQLETLSEKQIIVMGEMTASVFQAQGISVFRAKQPTAEAVQELLMERKSQNEEGNNHR